MYINGYGLPETAQGKDKVTARNQCGWRVGYLKQEIIPCLVLLDGFHVLIQLCEILGLTVTLIYGLELQVDGWIMLNIELMEVSSVLKVLGEEAMYMVQVHSRCLNAAVKQHDNCPRDSVFALRKSMGWNKIS